MTASVVFWMLRRLVELLVLRRRSDDDNAVEILVLRHELAVLRRQVARPRCTPADRVVLSALAQLLPRDRWGSLFVHPETIRRWHRALIARRWTHARATTGRPPTRAAVRDLVLRLARENPTWGYRRIHGELTRLAIPLAASSVWAILQRAVFIELASRKAYIAGVTANPTGAWTTQQARNIIAAFTDQRDAPIRFLIRDRDAKFTAAFDEVFQSEDIRIVCSPARAPKANAERLVGTLRRECLDRLLIVNRRHLERVVQAYLDHYNHHRPHRSLDQRPPVLPSTIPQPPGDPPTVHRRDRLGGLIHEYEIAA